MRLFRPTAEPLIVPFIGHGSPRNVVLGARVVLGRPEAAPGSCRYPTRATSRPPGRPDKTLARRSRRSVLRNSLARFLVEVAGDHHGPHAGCGGHDAQRPRRVCRCGRRRPGLPPGWHDAQLTLAGGTTSATPVLVASPDVHLGLVSDVDDTIPSKTGLTRGLEFLRITLLTEVTERAPPGRRGAVPRPGLPPGRCRAAGLLSVDEPVEPARDAAGVYRDARLPDGSRSCSRTGSPVAATSCASAPASTARADPPHPRRAPADGPPPRGRHRPARPRDLRHRGRENPDRIRAIYVRRTGRLDRRRLAEVDALAAEITALGVPMLAVDDSVEIAEHAASLGLLEQAEVDQVRAETRAGVGPFTRPSTCCEVRGAGARHDGG